MISEWGVARSTPPRPRRSLCHQSHGHLLRGKRHERGPLPLHHNRRCALLAGRWFTEGDLRFFAFAGTMLAFLLIRPLEEGVAIAAVSGLLVLGASVYRATGQKRLMTGLTDLTVYLLPVFTAFIGWAFASLVITGSAFDQFTSQYGNTAQIQDYGSDHHAVLPGRRRCGD